MNIEHNVDVLNDVTQKLIDSCKGYQMCYEKVDNQPTLRTEFKRRQNEREALVQEFQSKISAYGHEFADNGTIGGSLHRGFTQFVSVFKDDRETAIDALDDGEEHLADYIADKSKKEGLNADTLELLGRAHAAAREGERFADLLDD